MRKRTFAFAATLVIAASAVHFGQTQPTPRVYLMPPKEVVDAFDAPALPQAILSPTRQVMALTLRKELPDHCRTVAADAAARGRARQSAEQRPPAGGRDLRDHA